MKEDSKSIILPFMSLVLGILSVVFTSYVQLQANNSNYKLKMVEITYNDKKHLYTALIKSLEECRKLAVNDKKYGLDIDKEKLEKKVDSATLDIALFLDTNTYKDIDERASEVIENSRALFHTKINARYMDDDKKSKFLSTIDDHIEFIRSSLRNSLVESSGA